MRTTTQSRAARRVVVAVLAGSLTLVIGASPAHAQKFGLDPSFAGGKVVIDLGPRDTGAAIAIQADGKVVVTGGARRDVGVDLVVARRLPDGRPDPAFGAGGHVLVRLLDHPTRNGLAIQPDGRILVMTPSRTIRLLADGRVDPSWGGGGPVAGGSALALQPDGRVVVTAPHGAATFVARLNADGSPDQSFGTAGGIVTRFDTSLENGNSDTTRAVAVAANGTILIVGSTGYSPVQYVAPPTERFALIRLTPLGGMDPTFGAGGRVLTSVNAGSTVRGGDLEDVVLLGDGRIVVAGRVFQTGAYGYGHVAVARYRNDGTLDTSFAAGGLAVVQGPPTADPVHGGEFSGSSAARGLAVDVAGRPVVAGVMMGVNNVDIALVRFTAGGALDTTFDGDGWVRTDTSGSKDEGEGVAIQPDGRIVMAATSDSYLAGDIVVARVAVVSSDPFGSLDTVGRRPGGVLVAGWAIDYDIAGPVTVHVYVDGTIRQALTANQLRADVGAVFGGTGDHHGFQGVLPMGPGSHNVCVLAANQGLGTNQFLGCKNVSVAFDPFGSFDHTTFGPSGVVVWGWTIDPDVAGPVTVYVYSDGLFFGATTANTHRDGLDGILPGYGPNHGFEARFPGIPAGVHTICTFAINQAAGSHSLLGCIRK